MASVAYSYLISIIDKIRCFGVVEVAENTPQLFVENTGKIMPKISGWV